MTIVTAAQNLWYAVRANSQDSLRAVSELVNSMANLSGRKMIVLTSAGFLSGDLEREMQDVIHRALHAGVVINTLEARGLQAYAPGDNFSVPDMPRGTRTAAQVQTLELQMQSRQEDAPDDGLASLALGTGGRFFQNDNDLAAGYRELAGVPEVLYVLGISTSDTQDGRYHALKVKLAKGHHGSIQARPGYVARMPASAVHAAAQPAGSPIDREFLETHATTDLPAAIEASQTSGSNTIAVVANIDLSKLNLDLRNDRRRQSLTFIAGLLDERGDFVTGKIGRLDLALKDATFNDLLPKGLHITLHLSAQPGKYVVRGVVQESLTGKLASSSQPLEVH